MGRSFDISGDFLVYLLYGVQLCIIGAFLVALVWTREIPGNTLLAGVLGLVLIAIAIGAWRVMTGEEREYTDRNLDFASNSLAPGRIAKENWERSIRRIYIEDNESEGNDED